MLFAVVLWCGEMMNILLLFCVLGRLCDGSYRPYSCATFFFLFLFSFYWLEMFVLLKHKMWSIFCKVGFGIVIQGEFWIWSLVVFFVMVMVHLTWLENCVRNWNSWILVSMGILISLMYALPVYVFNFSIEFLYTLDLLINNLFRGLLIYWIFVDFILINLLFCNLFEINELS